MRPRLLLIAALCSFSLPARAAANDRPVMAFYYPWYEPGDWSSRG